jgi:predicted  nucleic acid-binding Zn ribbon protein
MKCPHCGQEIEIANVLSFLFLSRCEKCDKEFLVVDGIPMTEENILHFH